MDEQPAFGFKELLTFVVGDMAKAMGERKGKTREQHFVRSRAAVHMIMGFLPRDAIEAMLAGHCVMLREVMIANVNDTLHSEIDPARRSPRGIVVALNEAFIREGQKSLIL